MYKKIIDQLYKLMMTTLQTKANQFDDSIKSLRNYIRQNYLNEQYIENLFNLYFTPTKKTVFEQHIKDFELQLNQLFDFKKSSDTLREQIEETCLSGMRAKFKSEKISEILKCLYDIPHDYSDQANNFLTRIVEQSNVYMDEYEGKVKKDVSGTFEPPLTARKRHPNEDYISYLFQAIDIFLELEGSNQDFLKTNSQVFIKIKEFICLHNLRNIFSDVSKVLEKTIELMPDNPQGNTNLVDNYLNCCVDIIEDFYLSLLPNKKLFVAGYTNSKEIIDCANNLRNIFGHFSYLNSLFNIEFNLNHFIKTEPLIIQENLVICIKTLRNVLEILENQPVKLNEKLIEINPALGEIVTYLEEILHTLKIAPVPDNNKIEKIAEIIGSIEQFKKIFSPEQINSFIEDFNNYNPAIEKAEALAKVVSGLTAPDTLDSLTPRSRIAIGQFNATSSSPSLLKKAKSRKFTEAHQAALQNQQPAATFTLVPASNLKTNKKNKQEKQSNSSTATLPSI
jgi:hypothetical protein